MRKYNGFTLIELMTVIFIIGLLTTIVAVSIFSSQAKSRDTKRKVDLETIAGALEMYKSEYKAYPISGWRFDIQSSTDLTYVADLSIGKSSKLTQFVASFPVDPQKKSGSTFYDQNYVYLSDQYLPSTTCIDFDICSKKYALYTTLENQSEDNLNEATSTADAWIKTNGSGDPNREPNYRVGEYINR